VVLLIGAYVLFIVHRSGSALREAIAEADELDPGWRFTELESNRAVMADDQNSALVVLAAAASMPNPWPPWTAKPTAPYEIMERSLAELQPGVPISAYQTLALMEALQSANSALTQLRKLESLSRGRYSAGPDWNQPINYAPRPIDASKLATLLEYDALLRADGDIDGALGSCMSLLNMARAFGDAPDVNLQLQRMETRMQACRCLELILSQAEAAEGRLLALQDALTQEESEPLFLWGARGARCWFELLLDSSQWPAGKPRSGVGKLVQSGLSFTSIRPETLHIMSRIVEIAKLPVEKQQEELYLRGLPDLSKLGELSFLERRYIVDRIANFVIRLSDKQIDSQTELRCAIVALAAKRYQQARGHWPANLAELAPAFLTAVPLDPYDGQPIRSRRLENGIVVYSIGSDRVDNGGWIDRVHPGVKGTDVGMEIFANPSKRTQ
jgi:hypothetical protein